MTATLRGAAGGTASGRAYRWQKFVGGSWNNLSSGGRFAGATSATLTITSVVEADQASYRLAITNDCGSVNSASAVLTVTACGGDWNNDGVVGSADITAFLSRWFADRAANPVQTLADFNADGTTASADITAFLSAWFSARTNGC